jgi:hypothetical protein
MPINARKQARAIALAKAYDDRLQKVGIIALAVTMTAACILGLLSTLS